MNNSFLYKACNATDAFVIADVHLGVRNNSIAWQENIKEYFYKFLIPLINKHKTDDSILLILGDLFDDRKSLSIDTINLALEIIGTISNIIPVHIIVGNHDMFKKFDNQINSLKIFQMHSNVEVIEEPTVYTISTGFRTESNFLMLPHQGNVDKETEIVNEFLNLYDSESSLIFAHTDIAGLKYDNNKNINTGLKIKEKAKAKVYSGHIHKRQDGKKITYIGSPYQLRRSDIGNDKGVYHIFFDDKPISKFYKNSLSPQFKKVYYKAIIDLPIKDIKKIFKNNYIDILIDDSELATLNVNTLFSQLQFCEAKKIELIINKNHIDGLDLEEGEIKELSLEELIEKNIEHMNIDDDTKVRIKKLYSYYQELSLQEFQE